MFLLLLSWKLTYFMRKHLKIQLLLQIPLSLEVITATLTINLVILFLVEYFQLLIQFTEVNLSGINIWFRFTYLGGSVSNFSLLIQRGKRHLIKIVISRFHHRFILLQKSTKTNILLKVYPLCTGKVRHPYSLDIGLLKVDFVSC
jgi:hypothetical protein